MTKSITKSELIVFAWHFLLVFRRRPPIGEQIYAESNMILNSSSGARDEEIIQMLYRHIQREKDTQRHFKNKQNDNFYEDFPDNS